MLLGNHRDAWTFGAADASSGTAALMEVAKKLGEMKQKGESLGDLQATDLLGKQRIMGDD